MKHRVISVIILFFTILISNAQISVTLNLSVPESEVENINGEVCVIDSIGVAFLGDVRSGKNIISLKQPQQYAFTITVDRFEDWKQVLAIKSDTIIDITLQPSSIDLSEVTVNTSRTPEVTATSEIYKLTQTAKQSGDPYKALTEIPVLDVNVFNQTVKLVDGTTPLILIDGKFVNTGIAPIDPKFIESVEIKEVVSAKYLEMGVTKIININMKREVPLYTYIDARTRHDIPLREGFEALNFEFGTRKFAVGGNLSSDYLLHDKVDFTSLETFESDTKYRSGHNSSNRLDWEANLTLKWEPNKTNYFAGTFLSKGNHAKKWTDGIGTYNALPLLSNAKETVHNGGLLGAIYYEHSFSDDNKLTAYVNYNYGYYNEEDRQTDMIGEESNIDYMTSHYWEYEKSRRNQSTSFLEFKGKHFTAGNKFVYTQDISRDMTVTPNDFARVYTQSNYTYFSYDNSWGKIYYMASAGLQYMKIRTPDGRNDWFRPRISASLTYRLTQRDYLRLHYQFNSELPSSSQLFTFNHSTNPWLRIEGNPYLVPQQVNTISAEYRKNFSPFMLQISASTDLRSDMIEAVILPAGQQAISTFQNNGNYIGLTTFARLNYSTRKLQASLTTLYYGEKFHSTGYLPSVGLRCYAKWDIGNWFVYGSLSWQNRSYSAISQTRQLNPSQAHIQVGWYVTNELRLSVAMPYFWGIRETKTITKSISYSDITTLRYKSESLRPWILISYTIRRNAREAISNRMPQM